MALSRQSGYLVLIAITIAVLYLLTSSGEAEDDRTLVIYVFSDTDKHYKANLDYFIKHGLIANKSLEFFIILQGNVSSAGLLPLPWNARYVRHKNECMDIGTVGWFLQESGLVRIDRYRFIIWLNSSVRGPYLPAYAKAVSWHEVFTERLKGDIRMVGCTISCGATVHPTLGELQNPHIQSYVVALDQVGLSLLLENGKALACHQDWHDAVTFGELGISKVILDAGYNIDCLMARYQGVDWRTNSSAKCNGGANPIADETYDGIAINPLEVMFVKVKAPMGDDHWIQVQQAFKYQRWAEQAKQRAGTASPLAARRSGDQPPDEDDVLSNSLFNAEGRTVEKYKELTRRDPLCFDSEAYMKLFPEEFTTWQHRSAWEDLLTKGFWEGRPYSMWC